MLGFSMRRFLGLVVLILAQYSHALPSGDCPVPLISQEQSNWCWAGVAQMVRQYWDPSNSVKQCDDANYAGSIGTCNIPADNVCCGTPSSCNFTCEPQIQRTYPSTTIRYGHLTMNEISNSMQGECKPFIFSYLLPGNIPHFRVARGFLYTPWGQFIHFNDPNPLLQDQTYMLYNDYVANSSKTWYNIHP